MLALCLAVTSLSMAVARGQTRVAGEIVICTGYGITTMRVDAQGQPTGPAHICPDMALGLIAALAIPALPVLRPEGRMVTLDLPPQPPSQSRAPCPASARDPPVLI